MFQMSPANARQRDYRDVRALAARRQLAIAAT